jgi:hypothetical protein
MTWWEWVLAIFGVVVLLNIAFILGVLLGVLHGIKNYWNLQNANLRREAPGPPPR